MKLQVKISVSLIASLVVAVVLSFVLLGLAISLFDRSYSWYDLETVAAGAARDLSAAPADTEPHAAAARTLAAWKQKYPELFFTVFNQKRELVYATDERPHRRPEIEKVKRRLEEEARRAADRAGSLRFIDTFDRAPYMVMKPLFTGDRLGGSLSVSVRRESFLPFYIRVNEEKIADSYVILFTVMASIIALSFVLVFLFTAPLIRRLRALYTDIGGFTLDRPAPVAPDPRRDELGVVRTTFSRMAERIHADYGERVRIYLERQTLLRNISHDFRTPLTSILGYATALEEGVHETEDEKRRCYGIIRKKAEYMTRLFNEMMELTRLESGGDALRRAAFNLGELAREVLIEYLPQLETAGFTVETDIAEILPFTGDRERLSRLLRNLIDNVIAHAAGGRRLAVRCVRSAEGGRPGAVIAVADRGPGVREPDRERIFERFYSASGGNEGSGLGLAIAREIAGKHGGTIALRDNPGGGAVFEVFLPDETAEPTVDGRR